MDELRTARFQPVQADAGGGDPERPVGPHRQGVDPVVGQGIPIQGVMMVGDEVVAVVALQSVLGAEPHVTLRVLGDGLDRALRQPVFNADVMEAQTRAGTKRYGGGSRQREAAAQDQGQTAKGGTSALQACAVHPTPKMLAALWLAHVR